MELNYYKALTSISAFDPVMRVQETVVLLLHSM
jgi:hypothetical protein